MTGWQTTVVTKPVRTHRELRADPAVQRAIGLFDTQLPSLPFRVDAHLRTDLLFALMRRVGDPGNASVHSTVERCVYWRYRDAAEEFIERIARSATEA
jgi:hypothetical protein